MIVSESFLIGCMASGVGDLVESGKLPGYVFVAREA